MKMWAMNLGKAVEVPKLNEAMAIELGATLLGEAIIFVSGAVLVTAEVVRRNKKDAALEQARRDEIQSITDRLREMEIESSRQDAQLREITRLCMALQGKEEGPGGTARQSANVEIKVDEGNVKSIATPTGLIAATVPLESSTAGESFVENRSGIVHQAIALIVAS